MESSTADSVHVALNDPCRWTLQSAADFVRACGDWGVDLAGYDTDRLELEGLVTTTSSLTGTVRILGAKPVQCPAGEKCVPFEETAIATVTLRGGA